MNAREVNILLTKAALRDPRMKRTDPVEQADMAAEWAEDLADVALDDALAAVRAHYQTSRKPVMIADILAAVDAAPVEDPWAHLPDYTEQHLEESKLAVLAAAGVTEAEYEQRRREPGWVEATFGPLELEAAPAREEWLQ